MQLIIYLDLLHRRNIDRRITVTHRSSAELLDHVSVKHQKHDNSFGKLVSVHFVIQISPRP